VVGSVVDQKVAMAHDAGGDLGNAWLKTNSAGSGAYVLKSWTPNESVVLEANPNYRGGPALLSRAVANILPITRCVVPSADEQPRIGTSQLLEIGEGTFGGKVRYVPASASLMPRHLGTRE